MTHDPQNLKSFWVLIFRVSFVSDVSNGVQTPFVMYHMTQFVCIMMYHEQHADATNGDERDTTIRVPASMYQHVSHHFSCVKSTGYVSDTR